MLDKLKAYKNLIIVVVVVIAIGAGFIVLSGAQSEPDELTSQRAQEGARIEQQLVTRLLELQRLQLDERFLEDEMYLSLIDFHQELTDHPPFRENPFAPIDITLEEIEQGSFIGGGRVNGDDDAVGGTVEVRPSPGEASVVSDPAPSLPRTEEEPAGESASQGDAEGETPSDSDGDSDGDQSVEAPGGAGAPPPPPPPAPGGL